MWPLMISSLTQPPQKTKLECQPSKPEVESAELPLMAAILDTPKAPELSSVDREMARKREQERRRREAVSISYIRYLENQLKIFPYNFVNSMFLKSCNKNVLIQ